MTVAELIEKLSTFHPDLIVVGRGYEDGYDDIGGVRQANLSDVQGEGEKSMWWTGRYDDADYYTEHPQVHAVVVGA